MRPLSDTIRRLNTGLAMPGMDGATASSRLVELRGFGSNPGALKAWQHVPGHGAALPLVVVLHGCTQSAHGYDRGSGWSDLADRHGFAVLFPEQLRANNANLCFNWFAADDISRDSGEALSIRQMIAAMIADHGVDPTRVFVTGLSAGGAMTSTMLATYPDVFRAGAVIAGLPHGAALGVSQALDRMRGHGHPSAAAYAEIVRRASPPRETWPRLSVWHGTADRTVDVANAEAILAQWRPLHGAAAAPDRSDTVDGHQHDVWLDAQGDISLERYLVAGMGHGTPLRTDGPTRCGMPGPHMLDAGISSTWHIAKGWGLIDPAVVRDDIPRKPVRETSGPRDGVGAIIESALRSAGLMA